MRKGHALKQMREKLGKGENKSGGNWWEGKWSQGNLLIAFLNLSCIKTVETASNAALLWQKKAQISGQQMLC